MENNTEKLKETILLQRKQRREIMERLEKRYHKLDELLDKAIEKDLGNDVKESLREKIRLVLKDLVLYYHECYRDISK